MSLRTASPFARNPSMSFIPPASFTPSAVIVKLLSAAASSPPPRSTAGAAETAVRRAAFPEADAGAYTGSGDLSGDTEGIAVGSGSVGTAEGCSVGSETVTVAAGISVTSAEGAAVVAAGAGVLAAGAGVRPTVRRAVTVGAGVRLGVRVAPALAAADGDADRDAAGLTAAEAGRCVRTDGRPDGPGTETVGAGVREDDESVSGARTV